jgi:hypothetical protein
MSHPYPTRAQVRQVEKSGAPSLLLSRRLNTPLKSESDDLPGPAPVTSQHAGTPTTSVPLSLVETVQGLLSSSTFSPAEITAAMDLLRPHAKPGVF